MLVAEYEGHIVGGAVLKTFALPKGRKVGFVYWLFTDPEARGLGAGQRLIEAALDFFAAQGCDEISACVEGYNTSSSKVFSTRGFGILSMGEQWKRYGLGIIPYWWHSFHFMDVGHFLWAKPGPERPDNPVLQWWGTWIINVLLIWLAAWRQGSLESADLWTIPVVLLVLLGLRSLLMMAAAKAQRLAVRFRAWESSATLVGAIAVLFGGYFPFPGSFYPVGDRWSYRDLSPQIGPVALAGTLASLVMAWGSWALLRLDLTLDLAPLLLPLLQIGRMLAVLETVVAFFPLISFNGRRIWDWNRVVWVLVTLASVALVVVSRL